MAAVEDASIVKQVSNTGEVSYTRKEVDATSGKVSYASVEYCTTAKKFINISPSEGAACTKNASATKVSSKEKKACCAKGESKACCDKKGKKASTEGTEPDQK